MGELGTGFLQGSLCPVTLRQIRDTDEYALEPVRTRGKPDSNEHGALVAVEGPDLRFTLEDLRAVCDREQEPSQHGKAFRRKDARQRRNELLLAFRIGQTDRGIVDIEGTHEPDA